MEASARESPERIECESSWAGLKKSLENELLHQLITKKIQRGGPGSMVCLHHDSSVEIIVSKNGEEFSLRVPGSLRPEQPSAADFWFAEWIERAETLLVSKLKSMIWVLEDVEKEKDLHHGEGRNYFDPAKYDADLIDYDAPMPDLSEEEKEEEEKEVKHP